MPTRSFATPILFLASLALAAAQDVDSSKLDAFFNAQLAKNAAPSISAAVVKDGKIVYAKAFGYADLENDVLATPATVYRIGSITKQFTATMIMQLVGEGKLTLEQKCRSVLPELPAAWDAITVRQLLNHTSGIKSYTSVPGLFDGPAMKPTTPAGILKTVETAPLEFKPGTKWNYNNTAFEVLGMIVEKLDHRKYAESLKARILGPLGMTSTYFTSERTIVKHRAQGYTEGQGGKGWEHAPYLNMDWPFAAGSIESCTLDLAKWDAALYGDRILPQSALKQMWTPTRLADGKTQDYGFGWSLGKQNGVPIVEHGGGIHGFITFIRRAPSHGLTVIVLTNSGGGPADKIAAEAMGIVDLALKVDPPKAIADTDPKATAKARALLQSLMDGKLDHTLFTPEFNKQITPQLEAGAKATLSGMGKIVRFDLTSTESAGGLTSRKYLVTLGVTDLNLVVRVDGKGLVAEFGLRP